MKNHEAWMKIIEKPWKAMKIHEHQWKINKRNENQRKVFEMKDLGHPSWSTRRPQERPKCPPRRKKNQTFDKKKQSKPRKHPRDH